MLVKGARQIGKTFIIDLFGQENYKSYVCINFVERPQAKDIFDGELTAEEIYKRMTLVFPSIKFIIGDTLIFLDEIQECPNARAALKFLLLLCIFPCHKSVIKFSFQHKILRIWTF